MMKIILWSLGVVLGAVIVIKTEWFLRNFGSIKWADEHMGASGGSRLMYKLIGLLFIFISMMGVTGMLGPFILFVFGKIFGLERMGQ